MAKPSTPQLEKHIRASAVNSANAIFTDHARKRMRQRQINMPTVLETLRRGKILQPPEPDMKHPGLVCKMEWFALGAHVAVVVNVQYPKPNLIVITVIDAF